jgi:hypothetical protein
VFCEFPEGWRLGLIGHPRPHQRMVVRGHVKRDETQAEAAVCEATEESGRRSGCWGARRASTSASSTYGDGSISKRAEGLISNTSQRLPS